MSKRNESFPWLATLGALVAGAAVTWIVTGGMIIHGGQSRVMPKTNAAEAAPPSAAASTNLGTMEVAQALMVTVELSFEPQVPSMAEALKEIERRYEPADGRGRTFAILDAYGEPTPDGKKLHMSMHVSTEKPGKGALIFKRTGEILWQSKIIPSTTKTNMFTGKDLLILIDNGPGKSFTIDGSTGPATILDAKLKEAGILVRDFWQDGAEHEMTFIYSACGCPVKVLARREGERTVRTKENPVIFPDDPAAVAVITKIMAW